MPISPTNLSKTTIHPVDLEKTNRAYFFLQREDSTYLLRENYGRIILTAGTILSISNVSRHSISASNLSKS
jgi:hypothetical protein